MLVNKYKNPVGSIMSVEAHSLEDSMFSKEPGWTFLGQKEETLTMPKKQVMKYKFVFMLNDSVRCSDSYYASGEEFYEKTIYRTCVPILCIDFTGTLMDEDKNSL
jgi:hypothetical protein